MAKTLKVIATPPAQDTLTSALLGQYVRAKRTQSGLKIDEAAALCGVAKDTLLKLEHGHATVQFDSILRICAGLGIHLNVQPWESDDAHDPWV